MLTRARSTPDLFELWVHKNPHISSHLTLMSLSTPASAASALRFSQKRSGVHKRAADDLLRFIEILESENRKYEHLWQRLNRDQPPLRVHAYFDSPFQNLNVRKLSVAEAKLRHLQKSKCQVYLAFFSEFLPLVREGFDLFRRPNGIPETQCYRINPSFYVLDPGELSVKISGQIQRLTHYIDFLKREIAAYQKPLWLTDFSGFVQVMVREVTPFVDADFAYFSPHEREISLSRCFFGGHSPAFEKIDPFIAEAIKFDPLRFVNQLTILGFQLIPDRDSMPPQDQSIVLLSIFRVLFDRAYEKFGSLFCLPLDPDAEKLHQMSSCSFRSFDLPSDFLSESLEDLTLRQWFETQPSFLKAAEILRDSMFCTNPIDALFKCHKCLMAIHKGALSYKLGIPEAQIDEAGEILSFDDLFSLFFAVMLVSDLPDVFHLCWFLTNFVPKNAVTPSFEYVLANLEALMIHSRNFQIRSNHRTS
jgi:hypothetical protein